MSENFFGEYGLSRLNERLAERVWNWLVNEVETSKVPKHLDIFTVFMAGVLNQGLRDFTFHERYYSRQREINDIIGKASWDRLTEIQKLGPKHPLNVAVKQAAQRLADAYSLTVSRNRWLWQSAPSAEKIKELRDALDEALKYRNASLRSAQPSGQGP